MSDAPICQVALPTPLGFPDVPVPASQLAALQKTLKRRKLNKREKQQSLSNKETFFGQAMFCHFWI